MVSCQRHEHCVKANGHPGRCKIRPPEADEEGEGENEEGGEGDDEEGGEDMLVDDEDDDDDEEEEDKTQKSKKRKKDEEAAAEEAEEFKRPPGRAPRGKKWNYSTGGWESVKELVQDVDEEQEVIDVVEKHDTLSIISEFGKGTGPQNTKGCHKYELQKATAHHIRRLTGFTADMAAKIVKACDNSFQLTWEDVRKNTARFGDKKVERLKEWFYLEDDRGGGGGEGSTSGGGSAGGGGQGEGASNLTTLPVEIEELAKKQAELEKRKAELEENKAAEAMLSMR